MKTKLFYFTGTGNTLSLARKLGAELGDTETEPMTNANPVLAPEIDAVGILFPVYCWGMPNIVAGFVDKLQNPGGKYIFAVCTYGGSLMGSLLTTQARLKKKGLSLDAGWAVKMPGNYIPLYSVPKADRQAKMQQLAKAKITAIAEAVKNRRESKIEAGRIPIVTRLMMTMNRIMLSNIAKADKKYFATNACNGCGICAKVCPVRNITMKDNRPVWNHGCEQCLACLHWCPQTAIQYGKSTAKRSRYHNSEVSLQDMFQQQA